MAKDKQGSRPTIYIAGRFRGVELFNFTKFEHAQHRLEELGWRVENPHVHDRLAGFDVLCYHPEAHGKTWDDLPPNFDMAACHKRNREGVERSEAIFILGTGGLCSGLGPNGVREIEHAIRMGKTVYYEQDGYPQATETGSETRQKPILPDKTGNDTPKTCGTCGDTACFKAGNAVFAESESCGVWKEKGGMVEGWGKSVIEKGDLAAVMLDWSKVKPLTGEVRVVDPTTGGQKGAKPQKFHQMPVAELMELSAHYGVGGAKYSPYNYLKGFKWSLSFDACMRHLMAFWGGEDIDAETGSKHTAAAAWHCLNLMRLANTHPELDDRYVAPKPQTEREP